MQRITQLATLFLLLIGVAVCAGTPHDVVGAWQWPDGARRVFRVDRTVEVYSRGGAAEPFARYMLIDPATVDIKYADGHFARCRLQADGSLEITSRPLTGDVRVFRARRFGEAVSEGAAPAAADAHRLVGTWVFSPDVYATRVFEPGGRCTYRLPDGTVAKEARYRVVDAGQVVVEATDGWTDIFKLLPDGRVELEAKYQGVTATRTTGQRKVIAAAPDRAPVDAPVLGVWHPLNMRSNWPVVVLSDRTAFSPTHDGTWTYQAATREFVVTWRELPPARYRLAADGERLLEAGGTNQWRRWADAAQRARNRARLPDAAALTNLVVGDWARAPDAGGGLYACLSGGQVVKFKDATRGSVMNRGHFFIFREEGLAVVRWADIWRDYFPLPPGRSEWAGWNNRGEAVVRMRSKP